jgi:hypothetical protein
MPGSASQWLKAAVPLSASPGGKQAVFRRDDLTLYRRPNFYPGMGDPMRPLLWVSKSREKLAVALRALNHAVSAKAMTAAWCFYPVRSLVLRALRTARSSSAWHCVIH